MAYQLALIMEFYEWVQLSKSLASQQSNLLASVSDSALIAAYLVALKLASNRDLKLAFLCLLICITFSSSFAYDIVGGAEVHLIYSAPYLIAVQHVRDIRAKLSLFAMASFNCIMAWDYNAHSYQTWLSNNFEANTAIIHFLILGCCADRSRLRKAAADTAEWLYSLLACLWRVLLV